MHFAYAHPFNKLINLTYSTASKKNWKKNYRDACEKNKKLNLKKKSKAAQHSNSGVRTQRTTYTHIYYMYTYNHTCIHKCIHTHKQSHTHKHSHIHTNTVTYIHTHTHIHTYYEEDLLNPSLNPFPPSRITEHYL